MTERPSSGVASDAAEVEAQVTALILRRLYVEVPARDTDLFATGLVDSLGFVELLLGLREDLGVEVDIDAIEIDEMSSVERIADHVLRARGEAGSA